MRLIEPIYEISGPESSPFSGGEGRNGPNIHKAHQVTVEKYLEISPKSHKLTLSSCVKRFAIPNRTFLRCVREGEAFPFPACTLDDAVKTMQMIDAISGTGEEA